MNWSIDDSGRQTLPRVLHLAFSLIAMTSFALNSANVRAATFGPVEYRAAVAVDKFADVWQYAAAFKLRPPRRLRARQLELAVGTMSTAGESRLFASLGPVWRIPTGSDTWFINLGFSPTLIAGSNFNGRDLGGDFHFTSSADVGVTLGANDSFTASFRIQHTSNGGLSDTNPGMDMIGLSFSFDFDS